jgi:RNA polymerase sigma factor for flagellar operon FliA
MADLAEESRVALWWDEWHTSRSDRARDRLICHYLPLVEFLAGRLGRHVDASLRPDLVSYAAMGLIDAIERFRPEFNVRFETYGSRRIRGAVIDGIRSMKWLPRGAEHRASRVIEAIVPVDFQTVQTPDGGKLHDVLSDPVDECPEDGVELEADHAELVDALGDLPARERFVLVQHYFRRRPLAPIGDELGVTESRACQLHRRGLRLLERILLERRSA